MAAALFLVPQALAYASPLDDAGLGRGAPQNSTTTTMASPAIMDISDACSDIFGMLRHPAGFLTLTCSYRKGIYQAIKSGAAGAIIDPKWNYKPDLPDLLKHHGFGGWIIAGPQIVRIAGLEPRGMQRAGIIGK